MQLLTLSLPSLQLPCSPPRLPSLRGKRQGSPISCCISYLDTYILAYFLIRKEEKRSAAKSNLLLLEVYTDSLALWGSHQKLIVLEGVAHLLPFPNLISRLYNEARSRAILKMGRKRKKSINNQVLKLARCLSPSLRKESSILLGWRQTQAGPGAKKIIALYSYSQIREKIDYREISHLWIRDSGKRKERNYESPISVRIHFGNR